MLVGVDGSEPAAKALDYALNIAEQLDAEIQIVSVVPPSTFYTSLIYDAEKSIELVLSESLKVAKEKKRPARV